MVEQAQFWKSSPEEKVTCNLCPHGCVIKPGRTGICGVRKNVQGELVSLNYGKVVAAHSDPIEKKPLFHFLPGTSAYSIATGGCNLSCQYCQNYRISQLSGNIQGKRLPPEKVVRQTERSNSKVIAYTYTEPTIFFEYALRTAELAADKEISNVWITNGFINEEPLRKISPYLDACNIDLKSCSSAFYQQVCGGSLEPVLDTIRLLHDLGIWIEITTLVIPDWNDSEEDLHSIASFIAELDQEIPWHISRFRPAYQMKDRPPTPMETLRKAVQIGKEEGLNFLYQGNVPGEEQDTICPDCGSVLLDRSGFTLTQNRLEDGQCPDCEREIPGVW